MKKFKDETKSKSFQNVLYYIAGYFVLNEDVPTLNDIAEASKCSRQNIKLHVDKAIALGYLVEKPNRAIKKYDINFCKMRKLSERNREILFEKILDKK